MTARHLRNARRPRRCRREANRQFSNVLGQLRGSAVALTTWTMLVAVLVALMPLTAGVRYRALANGVLRAHGYADISVGGGGGGGGGGGSGTEPTLSSTGPRSASTTTITGDFTVNAGVAIANYHITGNCYLNGATASATDCTVDGSFLVNQRPGGNYGVPSVGGQGIAFCKSAGISNVGTGGIEVHHTQTATVSPGVPVAWGRDPARNLAFGINFHDNYVAGGTSIGAGSGFHLEVMHLLGATDSSFTFNHFEWFSADTATDAEVTGLFNMSVDLGVPSNNVFSNNWCYGGGPAFTLYLYCAAGTIAQNNQFHSYTTAAGAHHVPNVYSKASFAAGGTSMAAWIDPTAVTIAGNTIDGSPWDLKAAILA